MGCLVSLEENRMVEGLANILQCNARDAVRIALYEAAKAGDLSSVLEYSAPDSQHKGHNGRTTPLKLRLPKAERDSAVAWAKTLGITDKQLTRAAIIWLAKGIRSDSIKRLTKSWRISQVKLATQWSRENKGSEPRLGALKQASKEAYDKAEELGQQIDEMRYRERGAFMTELMFEAQGGFNPAVRDGVMDAGLVDQLMAAEAEHDLDSFFESIAMQPYEDQVELLAARVDNDYSGTMEWELCMEVAADMLQDRPAQIQKRTQKDHLTNPNPAPPAEMSAEENRDLVARLHAEACAQAERAANYKPPSIQDLIKRDTLD